MPVSFFSAAFPLREAARGAGIPLLSGRSLQSGRTSGFADASAGLRGAKLRSAAASLKPQIQNSIFKIQNYKIPPSCSPHGLNGPITTRGQPAAERMGLHERTCMTRVEDFRRAKTAGTRPRGKPAAERMGLHERTCMTRVEDFRRAKTAGTRPRGKPAAERTGLRRQGAALRPGAAAGCYARSGANSK